MFYFDIYYLILIIPALLLGLYAQSKVKSAYNRYSKVSTKEGYTGYKAARNILDKNGLYDVEVMEVSGNLTDHYDPSKRVVRLSEGVYRSNSVSAVGIAAHECGHAIQHLEGYGALKLRNAIIPITNIGSTLAIPLILAGMLINSQAGQTLITIGLIAYALVALFQLITLPVEFNASSRALNIISSSNMVTQEEQKCVQKVLSAAALTYVAALISSVAQLLRLFLLYGQSRNRH